LNRRAKQFSSGQPTDPVDRPIGVQQPHRRQLDAMAFGLSFSILLFMNSC
jgi:hypothetical protein